MEPADILFLCILIGLGALVLFWILYQLTQGVEGIGRRLYAMLLVLLSLLGAMLAIGVPIALCAWVVGVGVIVVATAAGIPAVCVLFLLWPILRAADPSRAALEWFGEHLERIKRVAQGNKGHDGHGMRVRSLKDRQLVGLACIGCGRRIISTLEGFMCHECGNSLHARCRRRPQADEAVCQGCGFIPSQWSPHLASDR